MELEGKRIADEDIYLNERRHDEPKEVFKQLAERLKELSPSPDKRLLDIGCATGEFLHFISGTLPDLSLTGLDVSGELLEQARRDLPKSEFHEASVEVPGTFAPDTMDFITANGVLCCLDDPCPALDNMLSWAKPGASLFVVDAFNTQPIDVVMRYRRASDPDAQWEIGWNVFARVSVERFLQQKHSETVAGWSWEPFRLPFALENRSDDPMRTWTIETAADPYQLVNGAKQLVDLEILHIQLRD